MGLLRLAVDHLASGSMHLTIEQAHYVAHVHRQKVGDRFVVFDPQALTEAYADIIELAGTTAQIAVGSLRPAASRARRRVVWIQALGKNNKFDAIVRDATELGATLVVPVVSERSVARPKDSTARTERWRRIAVEATRQSGRGDVPEVTDPCSFVAALDLHVRNRQNARAFCLNPHAVASLGPLLRNLSKDAEVTFIAGPEGGLADDEITAARDAGCLDVKFGPFILRTETVASAVLGGLIALSET